MTPGAIKIVDGVWLVGDGALSHPKDCCVYLVDGGGEMALVDTGAGDAPSAILRNVESAGARSGDIRWILLTHCHIDHTGGANTIKSISGAKILCHSLCAEPLEIGDSDKTAARWYGTYMDIVQVDRTFDGESETIKLGDLDLVMLHTPGHSPGSVSIYTDIAGERVLFGQDVHGPFSPVLGSDIKQWRRSMEKLLALEADILCEGHYGVIRPKKKVEEFIKSYLKNNG